MIMSGNALEMTIQKTFKHHVEANDLESENSSGKIAESIADLAKSSIFEKRRVVISRIISRNEQNNKTEDVNSRLNDV